MIATQWRCAEFSRPIAAASSKLFALTGVVVIAGCGGVNLAALSDQPVAAKIANVTVTVFPEHAVLAAGGTQQFSAKVSGSSNQKVTWSLGSADAGAAVGTLTAAGLYTAPSDLLKSATTTVNVTSGSGSSAHRAQAQLTIDPSTIHIVPATATVPAGKFLSFTASSTGLAKATLKWLVNGEAGGNAIAGTISSQGVYKAPSVDPGQGIAITVVAGGSQFASTASVKIVNPVLTTLTGASYAGMQKSWSATMLPWIDSLAGLAWDPAARAWATDPQWNLPSTGIALNVYYLEPALRPATRMAIARQDIPLMEELANFHLALLQQRATTIAAMTTNPPADVYLFIDGQPTDRTFAWDEPYVDGKGHTIRLRESQLSDAEYLSTPARLLRAIAELPAADRTAPLLNFVSTYSHFLVSEQIWRLLYGKTWWSHWQDAAMGNPVVTAWQFLAAHPGYRVTPPGYQYAAAMSDIEVWLVMDAAEVVAADAEAPELEIIDDAGTRDDLRNAVLAGTELMNTRCHHEVSADGADVLSLFPGEWDDYPDYAYTGVTTGPEAPTVPDTKPGVGWDSSHSYRFPVVFRSLYETASFTGATFPARNDLVALANSYVHLAFDPTSTWPVFNNFLDGTDGWFRVGYMGQGGYPPHRFCDAIQLGNCLTPGTVQGWGELAFVNPELASLEQRLITLAYDDSPDATTFKDQHYYYGDSQYSISNGLYPWLMIYVAGDSADRLK